jgi:hypothetical protein
MGVTEDRMAAWIAATQNKDERYTASAPHVPKTNEPTPRIMNAALRSQCHFAPSLRVRTRETTYRQVRARASTAPRGSNIQEVSRVTGVSGGSTHASCAK